MRKDREREDEKRIILYHRSYRKLPGSLTKFIIQFILFVLPFTVVTVLCYPEMTTFICKVADVILSPYFIPDSVRIDGVQFLDIIGNIAVVSFLNVPGMMPSLYFSTVNAVVCAVLVFFLPLVNRAKPLMIFLTILAAMHLVSALFFMFVPHLFPYTASDYSKLYMLQQVSIWIFVPIIMGIAIMPLPSGPIAKIFTMLITFVNMLLFGTVRYIVFLYILSKVSLIYMAILFFALGPLIDFSYIVGIYSLHATDLAKKIKGDFKIWKWQFTG